MPSKSATELVKQEYKHRLAARNRNQKTKSMQQRLVHKGALVTTASVLGVLNRLGVPVAVAAVPWKPIVGGLALVGEGISSGYTQAVASGIGDAAWATWIERSISTNTLIAGDDLDEDD